MSMENRITRSKNLIIDMGKKKRRESKIKWDDADKERPAAADADGLRAHRGRHDTPMSSLSLPQVKSKKRSPRHTGEMATARGRMNSSEGLTLFTGAMQNTSPAILARKQLGTPRSKMELRHQTSGKLVFNEALDSTCRTDLGHTMSNPTLNRTSGSLSRTSVPTHDCITILTLMKSLSQSWQ